MKKLRGYLESEDFQILKSSLGDYFQHLLDGLMNTNEEEGLYNAQWAEVGDKFLSKNHDGVRFGEYATNEETSLMHTLVVAQTGLGKTTSVTNTTLLSANGHHSYVVYDESKGIWKVSSAYLKSKGYQIKIFDLDDSTISIKYNPLKYIKTQADIAKTSELLLSSIQSANADKFWISSAEQVLSTFIELVLKLENKNRNIAYVKELITKFSIQQQAPEVDKLFAQFADDEGLMNRYKYIMNIPERTLGGIIQSIMSALRIFDLNNIQEITSDYENSFDLRVIREGESPTVIYLFNKLQNSHYSALLGLFLTQMTNHLMEREPEKEERIVYYLLDEVKTLSRSIPDLPYWLSLLRKYRVSITLIVQQWNSLKSAFKEDLDDIMGNTYTKCFFGAIDLDTAKRLSQMLGDTIATDEEGREKIVPLYSPQEIIRMKDQVIVVAGNKSPYKFRITPFYKQFKLNQRSKAAPVYK